MDFSLLWLQNRLLSLSNPNASKDLSKVWIQKPDPWLIAPGSDGYEKKILNRATEERFFSIDSFTFSFINSYRIPLLARSYQAADVYYTQVKNTRSASKRHVQCSQNYLHFGAFSCLATDSFPFFSSYPWSIFFSEILPIQCRYQPSTICRSLLQRPSHDDQQFIVLIVS